MRNNKDHESGLHFLSNMTRALCKDSEIKWEWDESRQPFLYRLRLSKSGNRLVFQIDADTLEDQ